MISIIIKYIMVIYLSWFLTSQWVNCYEKKGFVFKVYEQLIRNIQSNDELHFPPILELTDDDELIAYSTIYFNDSTNNYGYKILISNKLLDSVVQNDEKLLCFILSHELGHILCNHLHEKRQNIPANLSTHLKKSDELKADLKAIAIAIEAGFRKEDILKSIYKLIDISNNSPLNCLFTDHPSWSDRFSNIDNNNKEIWKSLSTFENGLTFLSLGYYKPAVYCFEQVLKIIPECYEAYTNIGYAKLMQYIELLDSSDIEKLKIGHIVTGAYYSDANTIREKVRGIDMDLWWDAVGALKMALVLKSDLTLALANLGLAYLVSPIQTSDLGRAARYFDDALKLIENDSSLSVSEKAAVYINAGVSYMYEKKETDFVQNTFNMADQNIRQFAQFNKMSKKLMSDELNNSIIYNQALNLLRRDETQSKQKSMDLFETYLKESNPNTSWWNIALKNRNMLCKELNVIPCEGNAKPQFKDDLKIYGLVLSDTLHLLLSEKYSELIEQLKSYKISESRVIPGKNLKRIRVLKAGIELLASEYLFAIIMNKTYSPALELYSKTKGIRAEIKVGMSYDDFIDIVGCEDYIDEVYIFNNKAGYRFYPGLGISIKINTKDYTLQEIIISHLEAK